MQHTAVAERCWRMILQREVQRGQAMVEFLVILPLVLMSIFACIQFALVYQAKTTLNYAVFQAAREAAVNRGTIASVQQGFAVGMTPLFTRGTSGRDMLTGRARIDQQIQDGWVRFNRISPPDTVFSDETFSYDDETAGMRSVHNDNLMYRNAGASATVGLNIQDANLLKLQVTYCYELFLPLIGKFLADEAEYAEGTMTRPRDMPQFSAVRPTSRQMNCRQRTGSNSIPIVASAIVRMQSDLLQDPAL